MSYTEIINFWFVQTEPFLWFKKSDKFDQEIKTRFLKIHEKAVNCEFYKWRLQPLGRLAEIIVLDQFSRNIFRDTAQSFAYDNLALALAQEAIAANVHDKLSEKERNFLYMPFMHSESASMHQISIELYEKMV